MTYVDVPPRPSRHAWRHEIAERAELHGWRVIATVTDEYGDMILIRRPRIVWVFAALARGRLSAPRFAAFCELRQCRQDAVVLRPSDIERVTRILEAGR